MHVSDRKGLVEVEYEEGDIQWLGGCGVAGKMLEFMNMNYEIARKLRDELTAVIEVREKVIHAGLAIMTRETV